MPDYPDTDFPWPLYFHGTKMPKWAAWWPPVPESDVDWFVDQVHGRIDHVGCVESEESDVFTIAAQQTLLTLIDNPTWVPEIEGAADPERLEIRTQIIRSIQQMIEIAQRHPVVFWGSGYQCDLEAILDAIRRSELSVDHPDYLEPPHRVRRRRDRLFQLNWQRKELCRRLPAIGPDKVLQRFIHELGARKA
jgi:hypothetical protein